MFKLFKLNKLYVNVVMGFSLTGLITFCGIFVTPILMMDYFFPIEQTHEFLNRKYDFTFDYHNISNFPLPVNSLHVAYREFNSSYLNHSDPYLVDVRFRRNSPPHPEKENYIDNSTTWKVLAIPGLKYNEWNVCTSSGTNNPPIHVHSTYIVYEVMLFSQLIIDAITNIPTLNFSTLGYLRDPNNTVGYQYWNYFVPDNWVMSLIITFENATHINIDAHKDGWLEYTKYEPIEWSPYNEEFKGISGGKQLYMEFGSNFDAFHKKFSDYAKTHIRYIENKENNE